MSKKMTSSYLKMRWDFSWYQYEKEEEEKIMKT